MSARVAGTLLFFWDYDTQWGADRSRLAGGPKTWGPLEFIHTERLLDLHAEFGVPACFAVVGAAGLPGTRPYPDDPDQVRRIHAAGHEIASHSLHHDWLPGLSRNALRATLRDSKDALEQCIGDRVVSFVPPYNQPTDFPGAWSFSISERREAGRDRTGLVDLCQSLAQTGYRFCRVVYRPMPQRVGNWLSGNTSQPRVEPMDIAGVTCIRLNTECGFAEATCEALTRCAHDGGWLVVYGHPHSLGADNSQDESRLVPFLRLAQSYRRSGRLRVALPRHLTGAA